MLSAKHKLAKKFKGFVGLLLKRKQLSYKSNLPPFMGHEASCNLSGALL